ncbi:hypothetical protein Clacol_004260 [Clathrus columnatus]|uniref:YABBY protein C-terminal domain-containing protein n=1 Tax=Clathrus columnatus TaxID=1419009 RepID=A0AAV5A5Z1_9AGAM|nr:hypothetical protein Clacol_004260 [Clathrus columnatus]
MPPKKAETTEKKKKSSRGGTKKISHYNKFVQQELARLKADDPSMSHTERFKLAAQNWKKSKENPKATA